ncbi:MAG: SIS domain-containing protein [Bacteroidales bacterium]|jgi:D-sedoheptulose 7-phosphate isomerase|nr:SIS domain-containing protein [Bacteroidales bacterium]
MQERIENEIRASLELMQKLLQMPELLADIEKASNEIIKSFRGGHKLLLAGNGGSAADSQHLAAEFVNKFNYDRQALPAIALTTDTSVLTSVGNDSSFSQVFARQIAALGSEGDIFIGISTSGNSLNVVEALKAARRKKIITIGLTGNTGGLVKEFSDICIRVPSEETPRIQEAQIIIGHIICSIVEEELLPGK